MTTERDDTLPPAAYREPREWPRVLNHQDLEDHCPLDQGSHQKAPNFDLGSLSRLPIEVLHLIFALLDLRTLTDVRRISRAAMQLVSSTTPYRFITRDSMTALRAILSVEAGDYISCRHLFLLLTDKRCNRCGDFASYICILAGCRVCVLCFTRDPQLLPLTTSEVRRTYALNEPSLHSIRSVLSVPGHYVQGTWEEHPRTRLYERHSAHCAAVRFHGSEEAMKRVVDAERKVLLARHCHVSRICRAAGLVSPRRRAEAEGNSHGINPLRFMTIVRVPYVDPVKGCESFGFQCRGCASSWDRAGLHWRREFDAESFERQIEEHGRVVVDTTKSWDPDGPTVYRHAGVGVH
jgi:hypothetical protein